MGVASKMAESCMSSWVAQCADEWEVWGFKKRPFVIGDGAEKRMLGLGVVWALGFRSWVTVSLLGGKGCWALAQLCSATHIVLSCVSDTGRFILESTLFSVERVSRLFVALSRHASQASVGWSQHCREVIAPTLGSNSSSSPTAKLTRTNLSTAVLLPLRHIRWRHVSHQRAAILCCRSSFFLL